MASSMITGLIGMGFSSTAGAMGLITSQMARRQWMAEIDQLKKLDPKYTESPYAKNTLGLAQTLLNSRMAGSAEMARNTYGAQANTISNINRNATDSSQALALAAGAQGQTDAAFDNLQTKEAQDYNNKVGNLNQANEGMTKEHKDMFDDQVRRWQDEVNIITAKFKATKQHGDDVQAYGAGVGASAGSMGSDKRIKHNYYVVGKSPSGINIWEFSYIGSNDRYEGVMAQEVPQASFVADNGFLAVDYNKIDVQFKKLN